MNENRNKMIPEEMLWMLKKLSSYKNIDAAKHYADAIMMSILSSNPKNVIIKDYTWKEMASLPRR